MLKQWLTNYICKDHVEKIATLQSGNDNLITHLNQVHQLWDDCEKKRAAYIVELDKLRSFATAVLTTARQVVAREEDRAKKYGNVPRELLRLAQSIMDIHRKAFNDES